jgi:hypothetical protein
MPIRQSVRIVAAATVLCIALDTPMRAIGQGVATQPAVAPTDADLERAAREAAERDFGPSASDWRAIALADGGVIVVAPDGSKGAIAGVDPAGKVWAASGVPTVDRPVPDRTGGVSTGTVPEALDPESAALNTELEAELKAVYQALVAQARSLQGARTINDIPIAEATLVFALLIRNLYVFQLTVHAGRLRQFTSYTREQKIAHIKQLQALAERVEYWWSIRTYLASVPTTEQGQHFLREQADQAGRDEARRAALLQMAERPDAWSELASAQIHLLLDQEPLAGASQDFLTRLWSGYSAEELVSYYDEALAAEIAEANGEITRAGRLNTVEGMTEFFGPQYARTRATAAGMVGPYSASLYGPFEAFARSIAEVQANDRDPLGLNTPMLVGGLIILSLVVPASMPLLLALVAAADVAVAGYALYHDVPYLLEANTAAANAAAGAGALGHATVAEMSDQQRIRALGVVLNALGVAIGGRALTQAAAEARAAQMVRRARERAQASLARDTPTVRENATGGDAPAAPADPDWATLDPNRTTIDPGVTVVDPAQTVIDRTQRALTQRDADAAAARVYNRIVNESDVPLSRMEVEAEMRLAREAGVPENDITQITQAFDPINGRAVDNWVIATKLLERRLTHLGYRLNVTREEWVLATQLWFRGRNGRLSPADVAWLQRQVNRDPAFFVNLPKYGKNFQFGHNLMTNTLRPKDGFVPVIDASGARILQDAFEAAGGRVPRGVPAGATPPSTARPMTGATATGSILPVAGVGSAAASAALGGGASGGFSEQQLADAALDLARRHFNTDGATWRTFVLPDGRVATTSLNQTQRVTAYQATGSDGSPRIFFQIDAIEGTRHVTTEIKGYRIGSDAPAERSVLPDLEGPVRPVGAAPPAPMDIEQTVGAHNQSVRYDGIISPTWLLEGSPARSTNSVDPTRPERSPLPPPVDIDPFPGPDDRSLRFNPGTVTAVPVQEETQRTVSVWEIAGDIEPADPQPRFDFARLLRDLIVTPVRAAAAASLTRHATPSRGPLNAVVHEPLGVTVQAGAGAQRQTVTPGTGGIKVFVTSLGRLGADAFRVTVVNDGGMPMALEPGVVALEPVARLTARELQRELSALSRFPQRTFATRGYCLEREKNPPATGTVFRLAPVERQRELQSVNRLLRAAHRLREAKALNPDTDPEDHYHSIVQWAIWAHAERFDERAFASAFTAYTRKNVSAAGHRWSREVEDAVREIVPNRWRDISRVLNEAQQHAPAR